LTQSHEFTKEKKVTLRRLLSHTAGVTVSGLPYAVEKAVPNLLQILNGIAPANSKPIRVDIEPGSQWRYSGGGFLVIQQLLIDVAGKPFGVPRRLTCKTVSTDYTDDADSRASRFGLVLIHTVALAR
jgi:hypothetical protein